MSKLKVRMNEWYITQRFFLPGGILPVLFGKAFDHPLHEDGHRLITSPIVNVKGNEVETENTIYVLMEPKFAYVQWCIDNKLHIPTKKEPIKLRDFTDDDERKIVYFAPRR